jgi:hypothetical protein
MLMYVGIIILDAYVCRYYKAIFVYNYKLK